MNIKLIVILVVVVFAGAAGLYVIKTTPSNSEERVSIEGSHEQVQESSKEGVFTGSIKDLLARSGSYYCSFSHSVNGAQTDGTVYVAGGKLRGDFQSAVQGISLESHMIIQDGFIYAWTPIAPNGFKIPQAEAEQSVDDATPTSQNYSDFQQVYTYHCTPWNIDESVFMLPEIDFVDASST